MYARFVFEIVSRYKNVIHIWEIWNEPNILPFWSPKPDAGDYAKLLKVAYAAAKKADPHCTIVGGAVAGVDLEFIQQLLDANGGASMDAISFHPYQGDLGSLSPDYGGLADHVRQVVEILQKHHLSIPIYITEIGHRTTGTAGHTQVTEAQQAAYLVRSYVIAQAAARSASSGSTFRTGKNSGESFGRTASTSLHSPRTRKWSKRSTANCRSAPFRWASTWRRTRLRFPAQRRPLLVVWSTDDVEHTIKLGRRRDRWHDADLSRWHPFAHQTTRAARQAMKILMNSGGVAMTNAFVIADEVAHEAVLFDAPDHTTGPLLDQIEKNGWTFLGLWLTHGHFDHVADHAVVKCRFPDSKILLHPLEEPRLRDPGSKMFALPFTIPPGVPDGYINDGDLLRIGTLQVRAIHTPGHSPGHLMFHLPEERVLVGGDLIIGGAVGRTDLPGCDEAQLAASIERVMKLPLDTRLLPGHGDVSTLGDERETNPYVQMILGK